MAKIFLIQPPLTADELFVRGSKTSASIIPPLGIAYIAAYLRKHGHECRILDGVAQPYPLKKICKLVADMTLLGSQLSAPMPFAQSNSFKRLKGPEFLNQ